MSLNKTREAMMAILAESLQASDPNDRHKPVIRTTEDFWGKDVTEEWKNGIWVCGECGYTYKGETAFGYHNESKKYHGGTLRSFMKLLSKNGWHAEWYDPGTVFIFPELHQNP
jgi:hypothetical protein